MGKRGGGQSTTTSYVSNVPEYLEPYFTSLVQRAERESQAQYDPYRGDRIADLSDEVSQARQIIRDAIPVGQQDIATSRGAIQGGIGTAQQLSGFVPSAGYTPAGQFTQDKVDQYMSPYVRGVIEQQKRQARSDFAMADAERAAQAEQAGAFGGSRFAIQESEAQAALQQQLQDIEERGLQKAYEQARSSFEADREAQFAREQAGVQAGISGAEIAGRGAQAIQDLTGAQAGLAGLLETIGLDTEGRQQRALDIAYEDYLRQRDKPREDIQFLSSVLQGVPAPSSQEITKFGPQANPIQQALGTGIAAYSLGKAYGGIPS